MEKFNECCFIVSKNFLSGTQVWTVAVNVFLTLAVGIVASITLFTDRLDRSLIAESQVFLGGDLKFETSDAIEESNIPNFEGQFAKIYEFGSSL